MLKSVPSSVRALPAAPAAPARSPRSSTATAPSPVTWTFPGHDLFLIVRGTKNALVELKIEGKTQLALVKDVQVHPVRRDILHADFLAVKAGEKVDVEVPVVVVGEAAPGTVHSLEEFTILVKAAATSIPENLEVSIEGLEARLRCARLRPEAARRR